MRFDETKSRLQITYAFACGCMGLLRRCSVTKFSKLYGANISACEWYFRLFRDNHDARVYRTDPSVKHRPTDDDLIYIQYR